MRTAIVLLLLALVARADDLDGLVDKLFHSDPEVRAAARREILAMDDGALEALLERIENRARKQAAATDAVVQFYDVRDLQADDKAWAATWTKLRALDAVLREQRKGVLVVRASKEVHARIAEALVAARRAAARAVRVAARLVRLPEDAACPRLVAKDKLEGWLASLGGDAPVDLPEITCTNGRTSEVVEMRTISYVADFEIEVAQGQVIADPVVRTVPKGIGVNVRPLVARDGETIELLLDVRFGDLELPLAEKAIDVPEGRPVTIQAPEARAVRVMTSRRVKPGDACVVDLGRTPQGHRFALVLKATPTRLGD
jgi:hypothetical protein